MILPKMLSQPHGTTPGRERRRLWPAQRARKRERWYVRVASWRRLLCGGHLVRRHRAAGWLAQLARERGGEPQVPQTPGAAPKVATRPASPMHRSAFFCITAQERPQGQSIGLETS